MKQLVISKIHFAFIMASLLLLTSCFNCVDGIGKSTPETREIGEFSKLEVDIPADVVIRFGDVPGIKIMAQENMLKEIDTYVKGQTLEIDADFCLNPTETIRIDITTPKLSKIVLNGSGNIHASSTMEADDIVLKLNGSGQISTDVFSNTLEAQINGSGDIIVNGTTQEMEMDINGSGDFRGLGLKTFEANVSITGSGDAEVNVLNDLKAGITGSGSVTYVGNPSIRTDVTGSGTVTKKGS